MTDCNSPEGDSAVKGFATVPYIQEITKPIRRVLNNYGIKVALKPFQTYWDVFLQNPRIITTNNRYGQRLCLEAWHINASPCALNRDDGSHLPKEYLHLVGR